MTLRVATHATNATGGCRLAAGDSEVPTVRTERTRRDLTSPPVYC